MGVSMWGGVCNEGSAFVLSLSWQSSPCSLPIWFDFIFVFVYLQVFCYTDGCFFSCMYCWCVTHLPQSRSPRVARDMFLLKP